MINPSDLIDLVKDHTRGRLYKLAALFLVIFAIILTLSPAVRTRSWDADLRWSHWLAVAVWIAAVAFAAFQTGKYLPNRDPLLLPLAALLTGWGILSIWRLTSAFGLRQTVWLVVGLAVYTIGLRLKDLLSLLRKYKYIWLVGGLTITGLTLIFGTNPLGYGPRLWLGCCGLYLQPSEPLKLLLIIYLAAYLADRQPLQTNLLPLLAPTIVMSSLALLLLVVQRDLGTAAILLFIYFSVIYVATGKRRLMLGIVLLLAAAGLAGYFAFDLIQIRIDAWINPWLDPSNRSYQIVQSLIAVAAGGLLGRGPGMGAPGLVPVSHSDFIFSSIAEEMGLVGTIALLLLLAVFTLRGIRIAMRSNNNYHRYLATGISIYLAFQSILIIGGNIRLVPLTGVTLPFVSYGGSSLVTSFMALLLLMILSSKQNEETNQRIDPKPTSTLTLLLLAGFGAAALVNGWWAVLRGPDLQTRTDNARRAISDRYVPRGAILDRDGTPMSVTVGNIGELSRDYLYPAFSPILGYTHPIYGQAGVEAALDPILRGEENQQPWQLWHEHLLYGQPPDGLDVRLSLDLDMQEQALTSLGNENGAVVVMDASSGEILVMASNPGFDANQLEEQWGELITDENAPLLNRATLGNYQPGSTLAPLLLATTGMSGDLPEDLTQYQLAFGDQTLDCTYRPLGDTWETTLAAGCPGVLSYLGLQMGSVQLIKTFSDLGFYDAPAIRLESNPQAAPATIATPGAAAAGQGDLRVSPLQLAIAASTISNNGVMPAPRLLLQVEDPQGGWDDYPPLGEEHLVFTSSFAVKAAKVMAHSYLPIWEISSLAFNSDNQPLTWFVGGTKPGAEQPLTIVVLLESKNLTLARTIGRNLLFQK